MNIQTELHALGHRAANDTTAVGTARGGLNRFARRVASVVALMAVASAFVVGTASPSGAAVRDGDGNADENVYCNSATHQITITTWSNGIMSDQIGGTDLFPQYLPYAVYVRIQKVVNGSTVMLTNWVQVTDGTHALTYAAPAGQTSYWYFRWAFQQPNGSFVYPSEWAHGGAPYGWYADQRGYQSLASCRT
jgi:hypothetical protein